MNWFDSSSGEGVARRRRAFAGCAAVVAVFVAGNLKVNAANEPTHPAPGAGAVVSLSAAVQPGSAWDVLLNTGKHRKFLELIEKADLKRYLDGVNPLTVFAPTDAAFDELTEEQLAHLTSPEGQPALRDLLAGHLMWDEARSEDIQGVWMRPTLAGFTVVLRYGETDDVQHGHGSDCDHEHDAEGEALAPLFVADVQVVERDVWARNGVLHHIESLISRSGSSGTSPTGELTHAPACEQNPDHQRSHKDQGQHRHRSGGSDGGQGPGGSGNGVQGAGGSSDSLDGPKKPPPEWRPPPPSCGC